jgi:regulator of sigma E protease
VPTLKPVVGDVDAGSAAASAGLRPGDEILAVGGHEVATREGVVLTLLDELMQTQAGIELRVRGEDGNARNVELGIAGDRRALTEPGALLSGMGFDFWYPEVPAVVGKTLPGSPAEKAGLVAGDRIVAVDGAPVDDFAALVAKVQPRPGSRLELTVERGGATRSVPVDVETQREGERLVGRIGMQPAPPGALPEGMRTVERHGPVAALPHAAQKTWDMSALTVRMLWNVATGDVSVKNLSGPINIAEYAGFSARQGVLSFLSFLAIVSVSLFVLNLLPIPILDGGQIVFQLAELAKGSPLSERAQAVGQQVGLLLLLVLMSFAFYNDLSRLFS